MSNTKADTNTSSPHNSAGKRRWVMWVVPLAIVCIALYFGVTVYLPIPWVPGGSLIINEQTRNDATQPSPDTCPIPKEAVAARNEGIELFIRRKETPPDFDKAAFKKLDEATRLQDPFARPLKEVLMSLDITLLHLKDGLRTTETTLHCGAVLSHLEHLMNEKCHEQKENIWLSDFLSGVAFLAGCYDEVPDDPTAPIGLAERENFRKGVQHISKAHELDDRLASFYLAFTLLYAVHGTEKNEPDGISILEKAVRSGNSRAAHLLGVWFKDQGDWHSAVKYYTTAAQAGLHSSILMLCHLYTFYLNPSVDLRKSGGGAVIFDNFEKGVEWCDLLWKLHEFGDPYATDLRRQRAQNHVNDRMVKENRPCKRPEPLSQIIDEEFDKCLRNNKDLVKCEAETIKATLRRCLQDANGAS